MMENGAEFKEPVVSRAFTLQTPQEFRDDFVESVQIARHQVGLETMQFEACEDTKPIFDSILTSTAPDKRFHYDRVARQHLHLDEDQGYGIGGRIMYVKGDKENADKIKKANADREELIQKLETAGIARPRIQILDFLNPKRPPTHDDRTGMSHNHIKIAIADNAVWFGSMNLRAMDFDVSNAMIKMTDPYWVDVIKEIFNLEEDKKSTQDRIFRHPDDPLTEFYFDAGVKKQSVIYEKALQMAQSLQPGDEFLFISQWPPVKSMFGEFVTTLDEKAEIGSKGVFLMSTEEKLHPSRRASRWLKKFIDEKYKSQPTITTQHLRKDTHLKALIVTRTTGEREVLFGSHNLSQWTVNNGTRELSMWSKDPIIVNQISNYISGLKNAYSPAAASAASTPAS